MNNLKLHKFKNIELTDDMKVILDEMIRSVKNDKAVYEYVKSIGINNDELLENNIASISEYKDDQDYCMKCPGYLNCAKHHAHYVIKLEYNGKFLSKKYSVCPLKIEDLEKNKMFIIRDFPASWRVSTLQTMDKSKVRSGVIKKYKEASTSNKNWIYITGSHRSGKSFVAATLLNRFIEDRKQKAVFINYPLRVRDLQDLSFSNKEDFISLINLYSSVDLLVMDDFGNEYKSEYIRDSITLAILNERARRGLVTIFTSMFSYAELESMYSLNYSGRARGKQLVNLLNDFAGEPVDITTAAIY